MRFKFFLSFSGSILFPTKTQRETKDTILIIKTLCPLFLIRIIRAIRFIRIIHFILSPTLSLNNQ